jgi:hypothetical protein
MPASQGRIAGYRIGEDQSAGRLHDRKRGRYDSLDNLAGIDSDLVECFCKVGSDRGR